MKLILHIGVSKTGTSAIQRFLYLNHSLLEKHGVYVPEYLLNDSNQYRPKVLRKYIIEGHNKVFEKEAIRIRDNAREKKCHTVVVSDESFGNIHDQINNVKWFNDYFDVHLVMYCRRQDLHIESSYGFVVMNNRCCSGFDVWLQGKGLDYMKIIDYYNNYIGFSSVQVVSYDLNKQHLIKSFLDVLGVDLTCYVEPEKEKSNITASNCLVEIIKNINRFPVSSPIYAKIVNDLQKNLSLPHKKCGYFTPQCRMEILEQFYESNEQLSLNYNNGILLFESGVTNCEYEFYNTIDIEKTVSQFIVQYQLSNPIRERLLKMLSEILALCKKSMIEIFPVKRTLLGAVLNNNFLFQDDYIELAVFESGYEKFFQLIKTKKYKFLNDNYILDCNIQGGIITILDPTCTVFKEEMPWSADAIEGLSIEILKCENGEVNRLLQEGYIDYINCLFGGCVFNVPVKDGLLIDIMRADGAVYISDAELQIQRNQTVRLISEHGLFHKYKKRIFDIKEHIRGKNVILFGAGYKALDFLREYKKYWRSVQFIDNDSNKWGLSISQVYKRSYNDTEFSTLFELKVQNPEVLLELDLSKTAIVITSGYFVEIEKQLSKYGISDYSIYVKNHAGLVPGI
nr:hypothetical protein [uncultured Desulfobacter sp.]